MKIRRDIASIPVRTAGQTWSAIIDLITGKDSVDAATLKVAASVMESVIAEEHPAKVPIVVKGSGSRLAIYLVYNEDAMEHGTVIDKLQWNPTGGNGWSITAPVEKADVSWMNATLAERAPRISVHDVKEPPKEEEEVSASASTVAINWGVLGKT